MASFSPFLCQLGFLLGPSTPPFLLTCHFCDQLLSRSFGLLFRTELWSQDLVSQGVVDQLSDNDCSCIIVTVSSAQIQLLAFSHISTGHPIPGQLSAVNQFQLTFHILIQVTYPVSCTGLPNQATFCFSQTKLFRSSLLRMSFPLNSSLAHTVEVGSNVSSSVNSPYTPLFIPTQKSLYFQDIWLLLLSHHLPCCVLTSVFKNLSSLLVLSKACYSFWYSWYLAQCVIHSKNQ